MTWIGGFANGFLIGFAIAAPVGPIGVLCIRRTLAYGQRAGFVSGLGAACADAIYGAVAALGLGWVMTALLAVQPWLQAFGLVFLLYLAVRTFRSEVAERPAELTDSPALLGQFASVFVLTLTNPATILSFIAIFAGAGFGTGGDLAAETGAMVGGVFVGSAAWWLLLSLTVGLLRRRLDANRLRWVNRGSAILLVTFALLAGWQLVRAVF